MIDARVAGVPMPDSFIASRDLGVLDVLPGGLHRAQQRRVGVAPRRLRLFAHPLDLARLDALALVELRQRLVAAGVVLAGRAASTSSPYTARQPASTSRRPLVRKTCVSIVVSTRVRSNTASGWKTPRKRFVTRS